AKSADDTSAVASLPAGDPIAGVHYYWATTAEAKALGLLGAQNPDGFVGFTSAANTFDYNNNDGVTAGQYDFYGVVAHEISEVMGRSLLVGESLGGKAPSYAPMDLFHFSAPGVRDFVGPATSPGYLSYFSLDNGATNLDNI